MFPTLFPPSSLPLSLAPRSTRALELGVRSSGASCVFFPLRKFIEPEKWKNPNNTSIHNDEKPKE